MRFIRNLFKRTSCSYFIDYSHIKQQNFLNDRQILYFKINRVGIRYHLDSEMGSYFPSGTGVLTEMFISLNFCLPSFLFQIAGQPESSASKNISVSIQRIWGTCQRGVVIPACTFNLSLQTKSYNKLKGEKNLQAVTLINS